MVGQARRSVQGCDLNARMVACRVRLAKLSQPKRMKSQHAQSRVHHGRRYASLTSCLRRDPANLSCYIGFRANASLMKRLPSREHLNSDIKINLSQASNTTLIKWKQIRVDANALPDVAIIAFSTSTLPSLTKEGIQHVVAVARELRNSNSRTFWTYQAFLVRKMICAYAGGRTSNYQTNCIPATLCCLNNFESVTKNLHTADASCSLAALPASHAKIRHLRCLQLQRKEGGSGGSSSGSCETVNAERHLATDFALVSQRTIGYQPIQYLHISPGDCIVFRLIMETEQVVPRGIISPRLDRRQRRGTLRINKLGVNYCKGLLDTSRCIHQCCLSARTTSIGALPMELLHVIFLDTS